jgi:hypothetical protein
MVWLVQNCRSNKCLISQTPQSFRGALPPWAHYHGSVLDPLGTLSGLQTPRLLTPPLTTNPGSAPDNRFFILNEVTISVIVYPPFFLQVRSSRDDLLLLFGLFGFISYLY